MTPPYLVRPTGPGEADVVDRATGERVGWVRADFWAHWEGFVRRPTYAPLAGLHRYRADAARAVWEATRDDVHGTTTEGAA